MGSLWRTDWRDIQPQGLWIGGEGGGEKGEKGREGEGEERGREIVRGRMKGERKGRRERGGGREVERRE